MHKCIKSSETGTYGHGTQIVTALCESTGHIMV